MIGTIIMMVGYGLVVITAHQESSIGLQSSQLLPYMFTIGRHGPKIKQIPKQTYERKSGNSNKD